MLLTKITIARQLEATDAARYARHLATAYVLLASIGITAGGLGALIASIRW